MPLDLWSIVYKYIRSYMITETNLPKVILSLVSIQVYSILYDHWNYHNYFSLNFSRYKYIRSYMITETSIPSVDCWVGVIQVYSILYDHWNRLLSMLLRWHSIQVYSILYDHWNYILTSPLLESVNTSIFDLIWSLKHS